MILTWARVIFLIKKSFVIKFNDKIKNSSTYKSHGMIFGCRIKYQRNTYQICLLCRVIFRKLKLLFLIINISQGLFDTLLDSEQSDDVIDFTMLFNCIF